MVLVVDDDHDIRETLHDVLAAEGYEVTTAQNGEDALASLRADRLPALILLDLSMPVMDGTEFRRRQRAEPALARIPVLVLSAAGRLEEKVRSMDVAGYLHKPVDLEQLLSSIERLCGGAVAV